MTRSSTANFSPLFPRRITFPPNTPFSPLFLCFLLLCGFPALFSVSDWSPLEPPPSLFRVPLLQMSEAFCASRAPTALPLSYKTGAPPSSRFFLCRSSLFFSPLRGYFPIFFPSLFVGRAKNPRPLPAILLLDKSTLRFSSTEELNPSLPKLPILRSLLSIFTSFFPLADGGWGLLLNFPSPRPLPLMIPYVVFQCAGAEGDFSCN